MDLETLCKEKIENAFITAEDFFNRKFPRPEVVFSKRLRTTAGRATFKKTGGTIELCVKLMESNGSKFVEDTPVHEAAHIITDHVYGTKTQSHGNEWKTVMRMLGQEPSRVHHMRSADDFLYISECGTEKYLTKIRHNKLQRGKVDYYAWKDGVRIRREDWINK